MRDSFTPEEVDRIENKAYEVGVGIGASQERERIIALLEATRPSLSSVLDQEEALLLDFYIAFIKGENE